MIPTYPPPQEVDRKKKLEELNLQYYSSGGKNIKQTSETTANKAPPIRGRRGAVIDVWYAGADVGPSLMYDMQGPRWSRHWCMICRGRGGVVIEVWNEDRSVSKRCKKATEQDLPRQICVVSLSWMTREPSTDSIMIISAIRYFTGSFKVH